MITVNTGTGVVTITDGVTQGGATVTGTENLLMQLALDRAAANTARVSILQAQLRQQTDHINDVNTVLGSFLNSAPVDPAKLGAQITIKKGSPPVATPLTSEEIATIGRIKDDRGNLLSTYFSGSLGSNPITLAADRSYNDVMKVMKSELNSATNQNQQSMISYQSLINQRNQMTEWLANLIHLLSTSAASMTSNLR